MGQDRQDGRWRYLYYDMEAGFNLYNAPAGRLAEAFRDRDWSGNPLFGAVMKRPDMQERFAQYYLEHCIQELFYRGQSPRGCRRTTLKATAGSANWQLSIAYKRRVSDPSRIRCHMEDVDQNKEVIYDFVQQRPDMIRQQMQELYGIEL